MKGISLKSFKKVSSDGDKTIFRDDAGHQVMVAHKALSSGRKKQLDAIPLYNEGGEVEEKEESAWDRFKADATSAADTLGMNEESAPEPQSGIDFANRYNVSETPPAPVEPVMRDPASAPVVAPEPVVAAPAAPQQATLAPAPVATPAAPMTPAGNLGAVANQYAAATQHEAQALGQQGQEEARIRNEQAQAQQQLLNDFHQKSEHAMSEINAVMEDYRKGHINPNRYLENMSSGQKVMTAIGMILGGMGAGLTRSGVNPAEKFLNDQISRDIKSQEESLGQKESLLKFNLQQYGNMKDAMVMTDAMMKGLYASKIEEAAARSKDPIARARGEQLALKFKAEIIPKVQELAKSQATASMLGNPNASPLMKIQALPKGMQDNAMKEYATYTQIKSQMGQVGSVMRDIHKNSSLGEKVTNPIQSAQRAEKAEAKLFPIIKKIVGERMTDADARLLIKPYVSGFFTNEKTLNENIADLENQLVTASMGETPILTEMGIVPKLEASPEVRTMKGVKYKKVPGGWEKVQ